MGRTHGPASSSWIQALPGPRPALRVRVAGTVDRPCRPAGRCVQAPSPRPPGRLAPGLPFDRLQPFGNSTRFPFDRARRHCRPPCRKARDHRQRLLRPRDWMHGLSGHPSSGTGGPRVPPWRGTREAPNLSAAGRGRPARPAALDRCRSRLAPDVPDTGRRPARPVVVRAGNGIATPSRANGRPTPDLHPAGNCCFRVNKSDPGYDRSSTGPTVGHAPTSPYAAWPSAASGICATVSPCSAHP